MSVYQPATLVTADKTVVALRHIESITFLQDEEEMVVDKLKGDVTIRIRTISGMESVISMREQKSVYGNSYKITEDMKQLREDIFDRWLSLIS
jgi:hypothetical protein